MMESAQKLFAKMYEQTQQAGGQADRTHGQVQLRVEMKQATMMML